MLFVYKYSYILRRKVFFFKTLEFRSFFQNNLTATVGICGTSVACCTHLNYQLVTRRNAPAKSKFTQINFFEKSQSEAWTWLGGAPKKKKNHKQ